MNYLALAEFLQMFAPLTHLVGGEQKKSVAANALERAHADLDARLAQRYSVPLSFASLPAASQSLIKRWVFYLAIREILAAHGVVISKEENSLLSDVLEMIDDQIDEYSSGALILPGTESKPRVRTGYGELIEDEGS